MSRKNHSARRPQNNKRNRIGQKMQSALSASVMATVTR